MTPDHELLRKFAENGSEAAFAELVRRHVDLVYSVALRSTAGDTQLAEDVSQAVFIDLSSKARVLSQRATLAGWLHTSARFAASKTVRGEQRRRAREQEAVIMNENTAAEIHWGQLRPLLDEGVGQLKEDDRDAIVLRFYQGKSHQEIGAQLGLSENSANKRVERALEKLRAYFTSRGVTTTSALLAAAITANSVQAAPTGLAANVAAVSLAGAVSAPAGAAFLGTFLTFIMNSKTKTIFAAVILVLLALITTIYFQNPKMPPVSPASSALPAPAVKPVPVAKIPAQVAAPVVKPAPVSEPVSVPMPAPVPETILATPPTAPAVASDPRTEINSAMNDLVNLLQSGDYVTAVNTYFQLPPTVNGQQFVESLQKNPDFPKTIQMLIDATTAAQTEVPVYNDTGDLATYKLSRPTDGKTMVRWKQINGMWYVDAFE